MGNVELLSAPTAISNALAVAAKQLASCSSASPRLDAELLLSFAIKKPRTWLIAHADEALFHDDLKVFNELITKRAAGMPIAYITGEREFWGRSFLVTPDVLIPRPETELLVELALESVNMWIGAKADRLRLSTAVGEKFRVLDLGTGSGCIAITLALEIHQAFMQAQIDPDLVEVIAVDKSSEALKIAQSNVQSNAQRLGGAAEKIKFYQGDWFDALSGCRGREFKESDLKAEIPKFQAGERFNLIVSNPPYIAREDAPTLTKELSFEPEMALFAADAGLSDLFKILKEAGSYLKDGGRLLCEIGADQRKSIESFISSAGIKCKQLSFFKDLAGHDRIVSVILS